MSTSWKWATELSRRALLSRPQPLTPHELREISSLLVEGEAASEATWQMNPSPRRKLFCCGCEKIVGFRRYFTRKRAGRAWRYCQDCVLEMLP